MAQIGPTLPVRIHGSIHSEIEQIVHRMSEVLFASQVALRRQHRCMPQQELNLFELSAIRMAEFCTCPPEIVRSNVL